MSEAQHTPGPWVIKENTGWDEAWCDWHDVGPISLMGGEADANSRLIAAAPDLLEALKETLAVATRNEEGAFADRARVIIAQAEGK
jgi:hypothetical protein